MTTIFQRLNIIERDQIQYHISLGGKASELDVNWVEREEEDGGQKWLHHPT